MKSKVVTRRQFLKTGSSAALAGALYLSAPDRILAGTGDKSRVVLVRDKDVLNEKGLVQADRLAGMLDQAVMALVDRKKPLAAWQQIVGSDDAVGIKTNMWRYLRTPLELEAAIRERLMEVGIAEDKIGLNDRGVLRDEKFINATALINVRPMRTHHWSGVGSLLKNYIMFVDSPSDYHDDTCADLAKLWRLPQTKDKTRLNILVMLTPQFHGVGPHSFNPQYTWSYGGLLVGFDPVAVDATGVRILQAKRREHFGEERPINPPPKHVFLADTRHHLGTADPEKIDLVRLGWQEDSLI